MNHIFRVIFDKTRGVFVAVSELAKARGKNKSEQNSQCIKVNDQANLQILVMKSIASLPSSITVITLAVVFGILSVVPEAEAAGLSADGSSKIGVCDNISNQASASVALNYGWNGQSNTGACGPVTEGSVVVGYSATTQSGATNSVVIGREANANSGRSVAIGYQAKARTEDGSGTAIGAAAKASGRQSVVVGNNSGANAQATALGSDVFATGGSSIAIGNDDIVNSAYQDKLPENTIRTIYKPIIDGGYYTATDFERTYINDGTDKRIYSPTFAKGLGAIAIGSRTVAGGDVSTALGSLSFALANKSTAVGIRAFVAENATGATAIGEQSRVFSKDSVAIGNLTEATNNSTVAYGYKAYAVGENSMALGNQVVAGGSIQNGGSLIAAYGNNPTSDFSPVKTAIDNYFKDRTANNLTSKTGDSYLTIGNVDIKKSNQTGTNVVVLGNSSVALKDNGIAIGYGTLVDSENSLGIGSYNYINSNSKNSIVLGLNNRVFSGTSNSIIGLNNVINSDTGDSVVLGSNTTLGSRSGASAVIGSNICGVLIDFA